MSSDDKTMRIRELESALAAKSHEAGVLKAQRHILSCRLTALEFQHRAVCDMLFGEAIEIKPPRTELTTDESESFTMGGTVPMTVSTNAPRTVPDNHPYIYTEREVNYYNAMLDRGEYYFYGQTDHWLRDALEAHSIDGKATAVFGSRTPWYETMCLRFGGKPTIIEYNPIISKHPDIEYLSVQDISQADKPVFDAGLSISSFEHDGLGRYGDPIDPDGDLKAMNLAYKVIRPGGLLFLSVPVGEDRLVFNAHRVYGRKRLPLLVKGWETINTFGLREQDMDGSGDVQPVIVLRRP